MTRNISTIFTTNGATALALLACALIGGAAGSATPAAAQSAGHCLQEYHHRLKSHRGPEKVYEKSVDNVCGRTIYVKIRWYGGWNHDILVPPNSRKTVTCAENALAPGGRHCMGEWESSATARFWN